MISSGTFTISNWQDIESSPTIRTGVDVGRAQLSKTFVGGIAGTSETEFTAAYSEKTGTGTYLAMESFQGEVDGNGGTFNFAHSANTMGTDRHAEMLVIVPGSGTDALAGITGSGHIAVADDGTHTLTLEWLIG